jgi:predicted double-glycine peptidase
VLALLSATPLRGQQPTRDATAATKAKEAEAKAKTEAAKAKAAAAAELAKGRREADVPLGPTAAQRFNKDFRSWTELKQHHVIMQQHDYSCGAAALATLMRYYFNDPVTEAQLLTEMINRLDAEQRKDREKQGFSMEDLFQASKHRGYQATVYPLKLAKLKELQAPVLVRLVKDEFKHFVIYRGAIEDRIYLADPIRGNIRVQAQDFSNQWNGVALILGKTGFGLPKEHGLAIQEPKVFRSELQAARRWLYTKP